MVEKNVSKRKENKNQTQKEIITCGLVVPISSMDDEIYTEQHWSNVKQIIEECLQNSVKYKYEVKIVSESDGVNIIQSNIIQGLYESDIIICDVSNLNPNVMFELGVRIMFDKPVIIIKDSITNFVFDVNPIEHIIYNRTLQYSDIRSFQINLLQKLECTFEEYGDEKTAPSYLKAFGFIETKPSLETISVDATDLILRSLQSLEGKVIHLNDEVLRMKRSQSRQIDIEYSKTKLHKFERNQLMEEFRQILERYLVEFNCTSYQMFKDELEEDFFNIIGKKYLSIIEKDAIDLLIRETFRMTRRRKMMVE
ncbi:hypothetical protein [Listeria seeligeri]|uniref:hypothetical protein n=1 Tax=Listeria seeligeri TaxID=1640 RepID=UPI0022EA79D3|nr:hypothetical protein [Listeria seeligeri]